MAKIIAAFDAARCGEAVCADMTAWAGEGMVDGYWFGRPGIESQFAEQSAAITQAQGA